MSDTTVPPVRLADLTTESLAGTGVFDTLMRTSILHLEEEFGKNRITGQEYATVYLGSLQAVLNASVTFLLQKDKAHLEAELLAAQMELLLWKTNTEKAQTINSITYSPTNGDPDVTYLVNDAINPTDVGVVGKQKLLYGAQTSGFSRDAEQKAAKILVDSWNVRRTTDEATISNVENRLHDKYVGGAVDALLLGIGAEAGIVASALSAMLTFTVRVTATGVDYTGVIVGSAITINLPALTTVTDLVASFTSSPASSVAIGGTPQVTGITANDFTNVVSYRVEAQDLTITNYAVTVIVAP